MSENEAVLQEFCYITGATSEEATFFLESAAWVLEDALITFYQSWTNTDQPEHPVAQPDLTPPMADSDNDSKPSPSKDKPNFGTLSSLQRDSSSDEEEGQRFFAGGSVHSGQEIIGPGKASTDFITDMFKSVRNLGGVEAASTSREPKINATFKGTGYRLGQTADDTQVVGTESGQRQSRGVTLRLWRNGFSVNDGPLRSYNTPANHEFLNKIRSGFVPRELIQGTTEDSVHLNMEDHRHEEYNEPKVKAEAFSGEGFLLGNLAPKVNAPEPPPSDVPETSEPIEVNHDQPMTVIQIRLSDGSRLKAELNHSHTIGDLRRYVVHSRPEYRGSSFSLLTTYPSKELSDDKLTLAEAGILNASILMRMK